MKTANVDHEDGDRRPRSPRDLPVVPCGDPWIRYSCVSIRQGLIRICDYFVLDIGVYIHWIMLLGNSYDHGLYLVSRVKVGRVWYHWLFGTWRSDLSFHPSRLITGYEWGCRRLGSVWERPWVSPKNFWQKSIYLIYFVLPSILQRRDLWRNRPYKGERIVHHMLLS